MKKLLLLFTIILAITGLIFIILLFLGYRPIVDLEARPDWEAVSSIATILAVLTALFITKWQDIINNRKNMMISWLYVEKKENNRVATPNIFDISQIDEICIRFINTGNRRVILDVAYIKLNCSEKPAFYLSPDAKVTGVEKSTKFPFILDPEMASQIYISFSWFNNTVYTLIKEGRINENDKINIVVKDSTGKEYLHNTNQKYSLILHDKSKR